MNTSFPINIAGILTLLLGIGLLASCVPSTAIEPRTADIPPAAETEAIPSPRSNQILTPTFETEIPPSKEMDEGTPQALPYDPALQPLVQQAMKDLFQRLGVSDEQIEVIEAKTVVWPDASLGCPQPGMRYTQVPVDGALIRLQAGGQMYDYHSGGTRSPFLCQQAPGGTKPTSPALDRFITPPPSENE